MNQPFDDTVYTPDTVVAIAAAAPGSAVSIVRLSGGGALEITTAVFTAKNGADPRNQKGYTCLLGTVHDGAEPIDTVVLTVFRAPKSYTGEDMAEFSCHGGLFIAGCVLDAAVKQGARLAGPGEFTKRAFLNGKISLSQAEAVQNLIAAGNKQALKQSLAAEGGSVKRAIDSLSDRLVSLTADLMAWIDFPEEDVPAADMAAIRVELIDIKAKLDELCESYDTHRLAANGVDTVIAGGPNVGKSTLMNLLCGREKSIVTPIPGTTRDVVEETISLGGVTLRLSDTAGIRESADLIEQLGIGKSMEKISNSQLVLAVFDGSAPLSPDDLKLMDLLADTPAIAVINKCDLPQAVDRKLIESKLSKTVAISAKTGENIAALEEAVAEMFKLHELDPSMAILQTARQNECATRAAKSCATAIEAIASHVPPDAVSVLLDETIAALFELEGKNVSAAVVDEIFARFCVGK